MHIVYKQRNNTVYSGYTKNTTVYKHRKQAGFERNIGNKGVFAIFVQITPVIGQITVKTTVSKNTGNKGVFAIFVHEWTFVTYVI